MARIFRSINRGMGITCTRRDDGSFKVLSSRGVRGPIDRYNVVGSRKKDAIHPFDNAHRPVMQMLYNNMCRGGGGYRSKQEP